MQHLSCNMFKQQGGLACYSIIGTELAAGHHHEEFDIDEEDMLSALEIWLNVPFRIYPGATVRKTPTSKHEREV